MIGFTIFLMDGKESVVLKMDQKKRISINKIDKMFKVQYGALLSNCLNIQNFGIYPFLSNTTHN